MHGVSRFCEGVYGCSWPQTVAPIPYCKLLSLHILAMKGIVEKYLLILSNTGNASWVINVHNTEGETIHRASRLENYHWDSAFKNFTFYSTNYNIAWLEKHTTAMETFAENFPTSHDRCGPHSRYKQMICGFCLLQVSLYKHCWMTSSSPRQHCVGSGVSESDVRTRRGYINEVCSLMII